MSIEDSVDKYHSAAHAMQTGVTLKMNVDPSDTSPKQLRVGVNSAMCAEAALASLLIAKGIITEAEYVEAQAVQMAEEAQKYQNWINKHLGVNDRVKIW